MAMAAAQLVLSQCLFDGCIASPDVEKRRRPYHRNCGCALHDKSLACPKEAPCRAKLSYPVGRGDYRRGILAVAAPACAPSSTGGSWFCGGRAVHGPPFEPEEGLPWRLRLQMA